MLGDFSHCKDMKKGNTTYMLLCECAPTCNWGQSGQGEKFEAVRTSQGGIEGSFQALYGRGY